MKKKNIVLLIVGFIGITVTFCASARQVKDFSRQASRDAQGRKLSRKPSVQTQLDIIKQGLRRLMVRFSDPITRDTYIPAWKEVSALIDTQDIDNMTYGANSQHELYTHLKEVYDKINKLRELKVELLRLYQLRSPKSERDTLESQMRSETEEINKILRSIYGNGAPNVPVPTTYSLLMGL
ncbi:MAG TPA: hypothetical protein QGF02_03395 [Candidatus Babeliales bacterium]|nr:hypothetical protein [Candidatus Babeliales bacterium]